MNMAVVFPDYDSAVELVKRLIDQGTTPQKITAIGQIVAMDRPNPLVELLDGFGTLSLEEEKSLLVAGAWAPRVSVVSSERLDGLFMEFGLPVQDLVQLEEMVRTGHYLVAVEDEAKEPIPRPEDGVLWAWPTSAVVH
ncbi:MAG TPA: hypothetical protein VHR47_01500 [Bacillota bacterium]|jgi:hypothetical protein|nr:hypothetical protein [Bacillota bacterium]